MESRTKLSFRGAGSQDFGPAWTAAWASAWRDRALLGLKKQGDELLQAGFRWQAPAWPRRGDAVVAATRADVASALRLFEAEGWLSDPSHYHQAPWAAPSLSVARKSWLGTAYEQWGCESDWEPHAGHPGVESWRKLSGNRTAYANVLRHREMDRPWILCLHGYGMGTAAADLSIFEAARLHRELGLNVMCMVLPFHGERAEGSRGSSDLISTGVTHMLLCQAQAVWDARRWIHWLREQGAERIGVHGVSLGGNVAALLSALEPELHQVIAGVPATDFTHSYRSAAADVPGTAVPWVEDPIWKDLREVFRVISPTAMEPVVDASRLSIYAGEVDGVVPRASVNALWEHWSRPDIAWYPGGHLGFFTESEARGLVERKLDALRS